MGEHRTGQVDTSAAEVYDALFVPALFGRFSEPVLEIAQPLIRDAVLDVACGTGALTRLLRARTSARVTGVDINPGMLEVARRGGEEIDWVEADATSLPFDAGAFDLATCQFGLMFLPAPALGVAEMARVARRGTVAVWAPIERLPGFLAMQDLFRDELGEDAAASLDAPFAMGAEGVLEGLMVDAGIEDAQLIEVAGFGRFDSVAQWVTTEVRGWTLGESVDDARLADLIRVAEDRLAGFVDGDGVSFEMAARVARWSS